MPRRETVRAIRRAREERRRERRFLKFELPALTTGVLLLLAGLPLPWYFGGTGLDLAFGDGTLWPLRTIVLTGAALALGAAAYGWRRRGAELVLTLVALTLGVQVAFLWSWDTAGIGPGLGTSLIGALFVLAGTWGPGTRRTGQVGAGAIGGGIFAYQLVGPFDYVYLLAGLAILVGGLRSALRHERSALRGATS
jgi:hypothetical protein